MISSSSIISWKCSCRVCIRMIPRPTGSRNLTRLYCSWIKRNCSLPKTNCGFLCKHAQSDWHLPRHLSNELISKAGLLPSLLIGWQDLENLKPRKSQMSKTQVGDATSSFRRMCDEGSSKRVQALQRAFGPSCCLHTDVSRLAQTVKEPRCQSIATRTWCVWNLEQPSIQHERYADNDTCSKLPYSSFLLILANQCLMSTWSMARYCKNIWQLFPNRMWKSSSCLAKTDLPVISRPTSPEFPSIVPRPQLSNLGEESNRQIDSNSQMKHGQAWPSMAKHGQESKSEMLSLRTRPRLHLGGPLDNWLLFFWRRII
jgi:hypothetical protein